MFTHFSDERSGKVLVTVNKFNAYLPHTTGCFHLLLFVLLLYVPSQQLWSWRDGQFTQPHFFLGRLEQAVNQ